MRQHRLKLNDEVIVTDPSHWLFRWKGRIVGVWSDPVGFFDVEFLTGRRTIRHTALSYADAVTCLSLLVDPK